MSLCCGSTEEDEGKPNKPRGCTDILCLFLFGLFWGLLIFIAAFAFVIGKPERLAYGQDSFGNTCGMKNEELGNMTFSGMDMTDRPYLFFLNTSDFYNSLKVCVKKCPNKMLLGEEDIRKFEDDTGSHLCRYDVAKFKGHSTLYPSSKNETVDKYFLRVEENACPALPVYETKSLFRRCIPIAATNVAKNIMYNIYGYLNSFDTIHQVTKDIYSVKFEVLGMAAFAVVVSAIMVLLIHKLASVVAWIFMLICCIACIAGTCLLWWIFVDLKWQLDSTPFNELLTESVQNEQTFFAYAILATCFTIILLLIVIVMRKRVEIVVMLFNEAAECIKSMPFLFFQPIVTFIALLIFLAFWIGVLLALATAYYPMKNKIDNSLQLTSPVPSLQAGLTTEMSTVPALSAEDKLLQKGFTLVKFNQGSWVQYMWWYHLIALIWTSEFIIGCQQMVIAGAVATWYFSRDRDVVSKPVCKAMKNLFMYHLGSVAMGAFLITIFKIPRLILTYMISFLRKYEEYKCIAWCLKCCTCCLWCMEKCIRYLNHNAYTIVAIQGTSFCPAAREAFDILVSNALQVATINSVGDFILFLGKCSVAALTSFFCVLLLRNDPDLHFYAIPTILVAVIAYLIGHCILSIYEMVIDTLFLCCCEDILKNDGSKEKPYFGGKLVCFIKGNEGHSLQPLNKVQEGGDASEAE